MAVLSVIYEYKYENLVQSSSKDMMLNSKLNDNFMCLKLPVTFTVLYKGLFFVHKCIVSQIQYISMHVLPFLFKNT